MLVYEYMTVNMDACVSEYQCAIEGREEEMVAVCAGREV